MRILADENVAGEIVEALRQRGHDVGWIRADAPGSADSEVLRRAASEERIVVTFDKDFGELAFRFRLPATSGIVLLRVAALNSFCKKRVFVKGFVSVRQNCGPFVD